MHVYVLALGVKNQCPSFLPSFFLSQHRGSTPENLAHTVDSVRSTPLLHLLSSPSFLTDCLFADLFVQIILSCLC